MTALLIFAATLVLAVLLSGLAERSVLSTAVLFLASGFVTGGVLHIFKVVPQSPIVSRSVELALFTVLFTEGMQVDFHDLRAGWRLPLRALGAGLPLTLLIIGLLAHWVAGLPWLDAFLLGAVLSPTDPVFARAIVGRQEVPRRLRQVLNIESGMNDGLALPVVLILLAAAERAPVSLLGITVSLIAGVALGIAVAWAIIRLEQTRFFSAEQQYQTLLGFSVGALVLGLSWALQVNELLAAFTAGITVATVGPEAREYFEKFGNVLSELLKLAALLIFGALISLEFLASIGVWGYVFAALVLLIARPIAMTISLWHSNLNWRERAVAGWFGPRGFASVFYALLVLNRGVPNAHELYHLAGVVIMASIVVHSSTDYTTACWIARHSPPEENV